METPATSNEAGPSGSTVAATASSSATAHPSGIVPVLQNIVATVNLECRLMRLVVVVVVVEYLSFFFFLKAVWT